MNFFEQNWIDLSCLAKKQGEEAIIARRNDVAKASEGSGKQYANKWN